MHDFLVRKMKVPWRAVASRAMNQLLLLLALVRKYAKPFNYSQIRQGQVFSQSIS